MSDAAEVEAARSAYERARQQLSDAHFTVVRHEDEINAHHPDGSVDYPWGDGPWDAKAEEDALQQEKQAEADARAAFEKALDAFRKLDPTAFAATARADAEAAERAHKDKKAEMDRAAALEPSSDSFWKQVELEPELERLQGELAVAQGSAAVAANTGGVGDLFGGAPSDAPPVFETPQGTDDLDTGHYDDGHAFGWGKPAPARPDVAPEGDTGHYDDGHAFGWGTKKKAAVAAGIVAALLAATAAVVALAGGGGSTTKLEAAGAKLPPVVVESSAPAQSSSSTASSSSAGPTSALPVNTVLAGCIAIDPQGNTTILHPGFLVANPEPGDYTATFAKGPTGTVHGTGTAEGNLVVTDVTITAFGTYDGLSLAGPDGAPISLGPLASQLPLAINAQTDKPNGCDPGALQMPSAPAAGTVEADHSAITAFLPQFSHAVQTRDVSFLVNALDPAVLARYTPDQCSAQLSSVPADPTADFAVHAFEAGPEPFTYTSDGQSTVVQHTYAVSVAHTASGVTTATTIHLSVDGAGGVHWFTDCTR